MLLLMRTGGSLLRKPRWLGHIQEKRSEQELRHEIELLNERLSLLEAKFQQSEQVEASTGASPYQRAIQLARQGRDVTSIAEGCGLSRGEAELIVSMHGRHD